MENDPPHESDGSTNGGSKEIEAYVVSSNHSGYGLPYAPEDFPEPGDKWGWKVGKRVGIGGYFCDRYLYLPDRLYEKHKSGGFSGITSSRGFASKKNVVRFMVEAFPNIDIKAFFASFTWKIPAAKVKGNKEIISNHPNFNPKFDPAGCKAGNIMCLSLLETNDLSQPNIMACDICCKEPQFCTYCCCILCSVRIDSGNGDKSFIKCEATVKEGFICGHICHIECALRSYMAGCVGGTIGLDAEYYCRRCDARTDLVPYVKNLLQRCESISSSDKIQKLLNLSVIILRGSSKPSAKDLLNHVQSAIAKLKERNGNDDIWKREDTSAVTTGEVSQSDTDTLEVSNFNQPQVSHSTFDYRTESIELEQRVDKTLASLKKAQESEYRIAEDVLIAQKTHLLDLYEELDKEKRKLASCSPSADPSQVHAVFKRMTQIKDEYDKITVMQSVSRGFGKTSKYVLKQHFGVQPDD